MYQDHLATRCRDVVEQIHCWATGQVGNDFQADVQKWRKTLHSFQKDICILLELPG